MLDVARAIVEKVSGDTMKKVDILSALAEVALERGLSLSHSLSPFLPPLFLMVAFYPNKAVFWGLFALYRNSCFVQRMLKLH